MKKKILLMLVMAFVLACVMAFAVNAEESVHNGKVDLDATVTLDNGTVCQLFDSEGNALIWYMNNNELHSIRADDPRVKYKATYGFNVGNSTVGTKYAYEVSDMWIALDGGNVSKGNIVVLNLMDDDVKVNEPNGTNTAYLGGPVNCVKTIQWANKIVEYAYLRLDTVALQASAFSGCDKLKYINISDLTELRQLEAGTFNSSKALFSNQILDLTNTKIYKIAGTSCFANTTIAGFKFPTTLVQIDQYSLEKNSALKEITVPYTLATLLNAQFNACSGLETVYMSSLTTKIDQNVFNGCTSLEKVFFVGSKAAFENLLNNVNATGNSAFTDLAANMISYADYLKLEDKSGKYVVYNYSYCEAYNGGEHTLSANDEMVFNGYFDKVVFAAQCTVDGCIAKVVNEEKTIGEMFVYLGYSYTETAINGAYSMSQFYGINKENIAKYATVTGNEVVYGFVISSIENPIGNENANENNVILSESGYFAYDYASVKITGITENNTDKGIVFCMYVIDGETVSYLDNGVTSENVACKSYDDVIALENAKKEER